MALQNPEQMPIPDHNLDDDYAEREECASCGIAEELDENERCYDCGLEDALEGQED